MSDHTGICYAFSQVKIAQISDGTSNTYMLGEKFLPPAHYDNGATYGDDQTLYHGHNSDLFRTTHPKFGPIRHDRAQDRAGVDINIEIFGSAHAGGCHFAMCDGSVRTVSYHIAPDIHRQLGNRHDGLPISASAH